MLGRKLVGPEPDRPDRFRRAWVTVKSFISCNHILPFPPSLPPPSFLPPSLLPHSLPSREWQGSGSESLFLEHCCKYYLPGVSRVIIVMSHCIIPMSCDYVTCTCSGVGSDTHTQTTPQVTSRPRRTREWTAPYFCAMYCIYIVRFKHYLCSYVGASFP